VRRFLVLLALAAVAAACADAGSRLREHTYPPSFEYIEPSQLHSSMWKLAWEMRRLDHALREPASDSAQQQQQVAEILTEVEEAVEGVATPGSVTQHPLLNRNLPHFRDQVRRARAEVARTPPSYFDATALAGSCSACHATAVAGS
jgi:hypothetical protein